VSRRKRKTRPGHEQQRRLRRKEKRAAKARKRLGSGPGRESKTASGSRKELSVRDEMRYIVARAQAGDARLVSVAGLVFFSTDTGDAWTLDPEDGFALCLARDGEAQELPLVETESQFAIDWQAQFVIDGDAFTVLEQCGRTRTILGYPTRKIAAACERVLAGGRT
jgi:hypothetical protein